MGAGHEKDMGIKSRPAADVGFQKRLMRGLDAFQNKLVVGDARARRDRKDDMRLRRIRFRVAALELFHQRHLLVGGDGHPDPVGPRLDLNGGCLREYRQMRGGRRHKF